VSAGLDLVLEAGVATLTFDRPAVLNALDAPMIAAFRAACEAVERNADVRCVVVRGRGPAFLAGGDVAMFAAHLDELPRLSLRLARELHAGILALRRMPKPVIASVHGAVAGAGISIMAACDLALAADDARFVAGYSAIGTSPDGGASYFLSRCLGPRVALEFLLLSEPIDAAAALAMGLVNRVVPAAELAAQTRALAMRLASGPTYAYAQTKRLLDDAATLRLEDLLEAEAQAFSRCAATADMREGVRAFAAKRRAVFRGD
jgi:2-(1,2-epoxy-1,2-dihydrophenyl)acetyl-CoA isomerase